MNCKRLLVILLSAMVVLVTACSSSGKNTEQSEAGGDNAAKVSDKPVEINLWSGYPELDPWFNKMADAYHTQHPNVTIHISSFPLRDFEKKVATSVPSNSAAEIITINPSIALRYIQTDMIQKAPEDLATMVKSGIFPKVLVDDASYNNNVYGIPHMLANSAIFYNTKMFEEAGIKEPPKTMDELIKDAEMLTKRDASGKVIRSGLSLRLSGGGSGVAEKFWIFAMQNGASILKEVSPGKYRANYANEGGLKTLQMYVDMVHKTHVDDPALKHDAEAFELQDTAMFVRETWVIGDIQKKSPDLQYATAPMPSANLLVEKDFYVTNAAKGDKQAAAWDFIRFLMQPENHIQQLEMSGWHPARTDLKLDDIFAKTPQFESFFANYDHLEVYPLLPEFDEIATKFADRLATKGYVDASFVDNPDKMMQFLQDAAKETNDILKQNGHLAE
ncbi:MAG TPA: extracellular solute-binding protein [Bacilli bacterium]